MSLDISTRFYVEGKMPQIVAAVNDLFLEGPLKGKGRFAEHITLDHQGPYGINVWISDDRRDPHLRIIAGSWLMGYFRGAGMKVF